MPNASNTPDKPTGSVADWAADRVLRGLIASMRILPFHKRVPMMGRIVRRILGPTAGYIKRAEANLAMIYPDMPAGIRRKTAQAVCDNFGRTVIENFSGAQFSSHLAGTPLTGDGLAPLAEAKKQGRPVLFVTGHFGNHEVPRHILTANGYTIGGLYRPMANAFFNAHYARTMTELSGPVFAQGRRGTIGFARLLKSGGMGTLLFDVWNGAGIDIPFLGKSALTATSAADLAIKFDALVLPYFAIRQPDGLSFVAEIEAPIAHTDPKTMTVEMTKRLEQRIHANPEQWFWVHRRWKPSKTG